MNDSLMARYIELGKAAMAWRERAKYMPRVVGVEVPEFDIMQDAMERVMAHPDYDGEPTP